MSDWTFIGLPILIGKISSHINYNFFVCTLFDFLYAWSSFTWLNDRLKADYVINQVTACLILFPYSFNLMYEPAYCFCFVN